jgi:2,4-dienoyl-CoA reductase-like NADH-dependent reductase (Old Yellow Enzyme family)
MCPPPVCVYWVVAQHRKSYIFLRKINAIYSEHSWYTVDRTTRKDDADMAFQYPHLEDVRRAAAALGVTIPLEEDLSALAQPLTIGAHTAANRLAIQPMEGCDGKADGSPDELTVRRYHRFAESGAGLIWGEATAVLPDARANPRQLMLTPQNVDAFKALVEQVKQRCLAKNGFEPVMIVQLTHSGRYSKPTGKPAPRVMYHCPPYEASAPLDDACLMSDEELDALPEAYAASARLAEQAGFDGVDIKACHRYLFSESLSAFTRPGRYGGSFDNRTRLLLGTVDAVRATISARTILTSRLNIYDGVEAPYGFGMDPDGSLTPDMTEPEQLVRMLHEQRGLSLIDFTIGNPYVNPHVNRPFDQGPYAPPEDPLVGVARMADCIGTVASAFPNLSVIASGLSYLRQWSPQFAAGMLAQKGVAMAGFGREAFAYPTFASDILHKGALDASKCCIACGKCTELMRMGSRAGCVVRDAAVYAPLYREGKEKMACQK